MFKGPVTGFAARLRTRARGCYPLPSGRAGTARSPFSPSRAGSSRDRSSRVAKPQQHEAGCDSVRPGQAVEHAEVELPFLWFDLVPGNASQHGVQFGLSDEPRPYRFMYSTLVALLLLNSPAKARNGLPSMMSCVAVPCFRK